MTAMDIVNRLNDIIDKHGDLTVIELTDGNKGILKETPPMVYPVQHVNLTNKEKITDYFIIVL